MGGGVEGKNKKMGAKRVVLESQNVVFTCNRASSASSSTLQTEELLLSTICEWI